MRETFNTISAIALGNELRAAPDPGGVLRLGEHPGAVRYKVSILLSLRTFSVAVVPGEGLEPPTFGLQNRCTTTVLTRRRARHAARRALYRISRR